MARTPTSIACSSLRFTGLSSLLGTSSVRLSLRNEINCSGGCRRCERITLVRYSPPCITARRGGCVVKKCCEATEADADGVVFLVFSIGKPPRPRDQRMLRGILVARPPLLAVMQGGEYPQFQIHSHLGRPPLQSRVVSKPSSRVRHADPYGWPGKPASCHVVSQTESDHN